MVNMNIHSFMRGGEAPLYASPRGDAVAQRDACFFICDVVRSHNGDIASIDAFRRAVQSLNGLRDATQEGTNMRYTDDTPTNRQREVKDIISRARQAGVEINDGNVVDLIADNTTLRLDEIRSILRDCGLSVEFPKATSR